MLFFEYTHVCTRAQIDYALAGLCKGFAGEMLSDKTCEGLRDVRKG